MVWLMVVEVSIVYIVAMRLDVDMRPLYSEYHKGYEHLALDTFGNNEWIIFILFTLDGNVGELVMAIYSVRILEKILDRFEFLW